MWFVELPQQLFRVIFPNNIFVIIIIIVLVWSSMARSLRVKNRLPQSVWSIINYLLESTKVA